MMIRLGVLFLIPLVLSLLGTPLVIRLAKKIGAMDEPNERKVHKQPVPRLGGVGIYASFFASLFLSFFLAPSLSPVSGMSTHTIVMLAISLTLVLFLGIWDDIKSVSPGRKFIGQCVAAAIVYLAGFRISAITHPFNLDLLNLGIFEFPATILWIVGITNAFNLIDGLDGLASGVAFIVAMTTSIISFLKGDQTTAMLALLLAGSVLGFLRYNFNGAKIFLGDSGSLFLGFLLAILSMQSSTKGSAAFSLIVPVLALGLPIMDTLLAMTRRIVRSFFGTQHTKPLFRRLMTVFLPDRGHIHHQLIARGYSHRKAVLILYIVSCLFGAGAFAVTVTNNITITPILITVGLATFIGVSQLRYNEMAVLRNGVLLPMYEWPVVKSSTFQGFLDLGFIIASFLVSSMMASGSVAGFHLTSDTLKVLALICGIRLTVFYLGGMYKSKFRELGMGDLLKIVKVVILSVVLTSLVLMFLPAQWNIMNLTLALLDFYILLSLVLGARVSFNVLNYLSRRGKEENGKKRVLIYGSDARSLLALEQILADESLGCCPVGFIDDDPQLEGKYLDGYPVFGGHWKLQKVVEEHKIDQLIISRKIEFPEIYRRIKNISRASGLVICNLTISADEISLEPEVQSRGQYSIRFTEQPDGSTQLKPVPTAHTIPRSRTSATNQE